MIVHHDVVSTYADTNGEAVSVQIDLRDGTTLYFDAPRETWHKLLHQLAARLDVTFLPPPT